MCLAAYLQEKLLKVICHILWYFQDGHQWPWKFHAGKKKWNMLRFLWKKCQIVCPVMKNPKMYSFMHLRCLVLEICKMIAICRNIFQNILSNTEIWEKVVLYTSYADFLTYNLLRACTLSFIPKLYGLMGLQVISHHQSNLCLRNLFVFLKLCVNTNNLWYVSLESEKLYILTPLQMYNDLWPI